MLEIFLINLIIGVMAPRNRLDDLPDEILSKIYQMSEVLQLEDLPAEILRKMYGFVLEMRRQVFDATQLSFKNTTEGVYLG
jgi:hypothetical protein